MIMKPVSIDRHFSTEWQLGLLNEVAYKVWNAWCNTQRTHINETEEETIEKQRALYIAARNLYKQCREADIFLSGVKVGRTQTEKEEKK